MNFITVEKTSIDFVTLTYRITDPEDRVAAKLSELISLLPVGKSLIKKLGYRMCNSNRQLIIRASGNQYGKYITVSFIPTRLSDDDYFYMVSTLNTVLSLIGKSFKNLLDEARVSRLDIAYDALIGMAYLLFYAIKFRSSGTAFNLVKFFRGPNPRTFYIGSETDTRFVIYDHGYYHKIKGQKLSDVIGKKTRIELRLKPKPDNFITLNQAESDNPKCRVLKTMIESYLTKLNIQTPSKPIERRSMVYLFLRACEQDGYQKMIAEQKAFNHKRARLIQSQLKLISLDKDKMVRDANTQIKFLVRKLQDTIRLVDEST